MPYRDDDYEPLDDREFPDPDDVEDDGMEQCPRCREWIYADAVRCPSCGNYASREEEVDGYDRRPLWVIIGAVLLLIFIIMFWI